MLELAVGRAGRSGHFVRLPFALADSAASLPRGFLQMASAPRGRARSFAVASSRYSDQYIPLSSELIDKGVLQASWP